MDITVYRIWECDKKKYHTQDPRDWTYNWSFLIDPDGSLYHIDDIGNAELVKQDEYVIETYTGCKDKNGKNIYQGDIVKYTDHNYIDKGFFVVKWTTDTGLGSCAGFALFTKNEELYDMTNISSLLEVFGNIHENIELLNN